MGCTPRFSAYSRRLTHPALSVLNCLSGQAGQRSSFRWLDALFHLFSIWSSAVDVPTTCPAQSLGRRSLQRRQEGTNSGPAAAWRQSGCGFVGPGRAQPHFFLSLLHPSYRARNTRPLTARNCMWPLSLFCASCRCSCRQADRVTVQTGRQTDDRRPTRAVGAGGAVGTPHRGMPSADAWPALHRGRADVATALRRHPAEEQKCQPESQVTSVGATAPLAVLHSCSSSSCNDTMNRDGPWRGQLPSWLAGSAACFAYGGRASE